MKHLVIAIVVGVLVSSVSLLHASNFDLALLSAKGRQAYQQVRNAREFAIGGVGELEIPSRDEIALRHLLKEEFATDALIKLLDEALPAGQMYALSGLHFHDTKIFERELKKTKLEQYKIPVLVITGCLGRTSDSREIIKDIRSGEFDVLLKEEIRDLNATDAEEPGSPKKTKTLVIPLK
jgi:hypothetical protein